MILDGKKLRGLFEIKRLKADIISTIQGKAFDL